MIDAVLAALLIGWGAVGWWLFFRERRDSQELFGALQAIDVEIAWLWPEREQTQTEGEKNEQD